MLARTPPGVPQRQRAHEQRAEGCGEPREDSQWQSVEV